MLSNVSDVSSAWEEGAAKLVEADCHDSVSGQEGFLDAIAVMDIDVHVQHPLVILQQFQDGQYNVVDVAEARRLNSESSPHQ